MTSEKWSPNHRRTLRVVFVFWLVAWFINAPGNPGFLRNFVDARLHPIHFEVFPALMTDPTVAYAIYLSPLACVPVLFLQHARAWQAAAGLTVVSSLLALMHLETGSDATFLTTFWVSLWLVWLSRHIDHQESRHLVVGRGIAHAIVGLIFVGALVGKLTPAFHDGSAFFGLYFEHGKGFPYDTLRDGRTATEYRALATWFSRGAISAEAMLAASPILPTRAVLPLYVGVMIAMMIARNYNLFSVLGAPLGMLIGTEFMRRELATR